ncbi:MAG: S-methyl-5'-thioinosine phosphorylase [Wenzhouxiangella sp.]
MTLAIIGGTGALELFERCGEPIAFEHEPWGAPSSAPLPIALGAAQAWFLARHGRPHRIPPHRINYRANIACLRDLGVRHIVAINAVGGIAPELAAGDLVLPDQLIDYTWGRVHSFSDDADSSLAHVEFAQPFAGPCREALQAAAGRRGIKLHPRGCYAVTQGPRLETAAEVRRLAADGCTVVGMTAMPEAALAREAGIDYASLCVVANPAAAEQAAPISLDAIHRVLDQAMGTVKALLLQWAAELAA